MNYTEYITASLSKSTTGASLSVLLFAVVGIYACLSASGENYLKPETVAKMVNACIENEEGCVHEIVVRPFIEENIVPLLIGEDVSTFRNLAEKYDRMEINGKKLHTAIRYGLTQALLNACAQANHLTMAEVIRKEYNISEKEYKPVAIFAQSGDDRYINADKMIIKEADVLPHALINHVETKLGKNGELLKDYDKEWDTSDEIRYSNVCCTFS